MSEDYTSFESDLSVLNQIADQFIAVTRCNDISNEGTFPVPISPVSWIKSFESLIIIPKIIIATCPIMSSIKMNTSLFDFFHCDCCPLR